MARIHIRQTDDQGKTAGLFRGKTCLFIGNRDTIETIGFAIRAKRAAEKASAR